MSDSTTEQNVLTVFAPRDILQNQLLRVPAVRRRANDRATTGVVVDRSAADEVIDEFLRHCTIDLATVELLELGPGRSSALLKAAAARGARCAAFDVTDHLGDDEYASSGAVDVRVGPPGRLPWPDDTFDLVWSNSVLEHVPEPVPTLSEVRRVLRPGGWTVAMIDLESHLGGRRDPQRMYEFLRYPGWLWWLMSSNRSTYLNRLRRSEWREAFAASGLEIVAEDAVLSDRPVAEFRTVPYLRNLSDEDLLTRRFTVTARPAT